MSDDKLQPKKLTIGRFFKEIFNWYPSEYPTEERKLLFKLDLSISVFACLCFFVKYLDQTNISNAYVSDLKEQFSLSANQLNYLNISSFTTYILFQIPTLLLISRPKLARWLLPILERRYIRAESSDKYPPTICDAVFGGHVGGAGVRGDAFYIGELG